MPYLPKETFSAKSTQYISLKAYKKLYTASLWTHKPGNRYTQNDDARRGLIITSKKVIKNEEINK